MADGGDDSRSNVRVRFAAVADADMTARNTISQSLATKVVRGLPAWRRPVLIWAHEMARAWHLQAAETEFEWWARRRGCVGEFR